MQATRVADNTPRSTHSQEASSVRNGTDTTGQWIRFGRVEPGCLSPFGKSDLYIVER
jgi:hypothetical protein